MVVTLFAAMPVRRCPSTVEPPRSSSRSVAEWDLLVAGASMA